MLKLKDLDKFQKPFKIEDLFYSSVKRIRDASDEIVVRELESDYAKEVCDCLNNDDAIGMILLLAQSRLGCGCYESSSHCTPCEEASDLIDEYLAEKEPRR